MKRVIIALAILTTPLLLLAQLQGQYCHSRGWGHTCISFSDSSKFEYSFVDCTNLMVGKGTYKIKYNNLTLNFEPYQTDVTKYNVQLDSAIKLLDTATIEVEVYDYEGRYPLVAAVVTARDKSGDYITGVAMDTSGHGILKVPRSLKASRIKFQYVGYPDFSLSLSLSADVKLIVYLMIGRADIYKSTREMKFKIRGTGNRKSLLQKKNGRSLVYTKSKV